MIFVFDLDDTLYEEKTFYINGLRAVAKFFSKKLNLEENKCFLKLINDTKLYGRKKILNRFLKNYKILSKKNLTLAINIFRKNNLKLKIYSDTKKIFSKYKKINKYIVTDGNKYVQKNKIQILGIKKYFKKILISRNYGIKYEKPSLHCFKKILTSENSNWNSLVYVADNPIKDFVNLNRMGSITVQIKRGNYKYIKPKKKIYDAKFKFKSFNKSFFDLLDSYEYKYKNRR